MAIAFQVCRALALNTRTNTVADMFSRGVVCAAEQYKDGIEAYPVGGHIRVNPWNDQLQMLKEPVGTVVPHEKKPFQITPLAPYLRWQESNSPAEGPTESPTEVPPESGHATP